MRTDGRQSTDLRPVAIAPGFLPAAEGSALIEIGHTKVICSASVEDAVPAWLRGAGRGWITAEYGMLPRATSTRTAREVNRGRPGGRTQEIQRLIGRALRSVTRLEQLGERTIYIDCDVLQADGGTRTAAITGGWVALALALQQMVEFRMIAAMPLREPLAAVSVGIVDGVPMLDLCYEEDSRAEVDMNVVMTAAGEYAEVQSTGETRTFTLGQLQQMLELAKDGIAQLIAVQKSIVTL
jgi:ribonuclease PH